LLVVSALALVATVGDATILLRYRRSRNHPLKDSTPPPLPLTRPPAVPSQPALDPGHLFDFLRKQPDTDIYRVMNMEGPLIGAVIARFLPLDQRARLLQSLSPKERIDVERLGTRLNEMPSSEFIRIADTIRRRLFPASAVNEGKRDDYSFWAETLERTQSRQALIASLEKTRPDLKELWERYQVKLEDIPSLPRPRIEAVLSALTDKELSLALSACPREVAESLVTDLPPNRRKRILLRIRAQGALPRSLTEPAVKALVRRFHERSL
ncbi:MAG: hypothetical protein HYR96_00135, partial [Deltaproteobacteria bacterium]|nr:hypothetical protein [Deltaproteobacteria bacterium]